MTSPVDDVNMKNEEKEDSVTEDDETHKKSLELQEQSLGPLKEDLAEWIAKTLGKVLIRTCPCNEYLLNAVYPTFIY